jgi:hypothetical protein
MAKRTEITNYLIHQLKGISNDPTTNRANGIAQLTNGAVSGVTLDFPGRFYDSATVEFSSPGQVTANVIPSIVDGNVTFTVDTGGGSYVSNPDISVDITRTEIGFTTEQAKFGNNSWEVNTATNLPFTLPFNQYGVMGFWVWPSDQIVNTNYNIMRVGGDSNNGVVVYVQEYQGSLNIGIHFENDPFPNNSSVSGLTANSWNYCSYQVRNSGGSQEDVFIYKSGSGAGRSNKNGYNFTDNNVQILTGTANGLVYLDDIHFTNRSTAIFPDPTTANPDPGSTFLYEDFESPNLVDATVTTNAAISSNTVVAVSAINTNYSITAAQINSVDAPLNSLDPATGTVQVDTTAGIVTGVTIVDGSQYTEAPTVTFSNSALTFSSSPTLVTRRMQYLGDVNDFPTITLGARPGDQFYHIGDGQIFKSMRTSIRGYVNTHEDDSIGDADALANDVETVISRFQDEAANLEVQRSQVLEVRTDEGLFTPYGIVDMQIEILYEES